MAFSQFQPVATPVALQVEKKQSAPYNRPTRLPTKTAIDLWGVATNASDYRTAIGPILPDTSNHNPKH